MHVPPDQDKQPSPNITQLGLGTERTVVLVFATDCKECVPLLEFYKTLLNAPGMDGKRKRMVVLALDGVVPVRKLLDAHGFKPHRLTSYPRIENTIELPDRGPGILVVDGGGVRVGMWTGALTEAQQKEVIAAVGG